MPYYSFAREDKKDTEKKTIPGFPSYMNYIYVTCEGQIVKSKITQLMN